jgi:hypothetical protein
MRGIQVLVQTRAQLISAARRTHDTPTGKDRCRVRKRSVVRGREGRAWAGLGYSSESSASVFAISQFRNSPGPSGCEANNLRLQYNGCRGTTWVFFIVKLSSCRDMILSRMRIL